MAKVALLIGVSEYQHGFNKLPGVVQDVEAMQQVLQDPEIGGFDVTKLINCNRQQMEEAIETFFSGSQTNDLVLLYFSGHGIKDEIEDLYFATCTTRKNFQGELIKATAVAAEFIKDTMSRSCSKRQVLILDCCYSGAFGQHMLHKDTKDNGLVDIKTQLGGEGRAVLTSSTSTQRSFDLIYTQCLVKGMESGEADLDNDGYISVEELHEYTIQQVQKVKPEMKPEIYQIIKDDTIRLAQVPNKYEKTFDRLSANGKISDTDRLILNALINQLQITPVKAEEIEEKVLERNKKYKENLALYKKAFIDCIGREYPHKKAFIDCIGRKYLLSREAQSDLKILQNHLSLKDKDIVIIEKTVTDGMKKLPTMKMQHLLIMIIGSVLTGTFFVWVKNLIPHPPPVIPVAGDTFRTISNVPDGTFKYGGSGAWTPIHPKLDSEIKKVHNQFHLQFLTRDKQGNLEIGSRESIDMLLKGEIDFALSNLPISEKEKSEAKKKKFTIEQIPVAKNGVAVAVNPNLNVPHLTLEQLRDIYTGKIPNWKDVGGPDTDIKIYTSGGGIQSSTDWIITILKIPNKDSLAELTPIATANEAFNKIANDIGGISLSSASLVVPQCSIKSLPLVGNRNKVVPPYQQNNFVPFSQCSKVKRNLVNVQAIYSGDYPLTNDLSVVIKQNGQTQERAGRAYGNLLNTKEGQKMIKQLQETGNL